MIDQAGRDLDDVAAALVEHLLDRQLGDAEEAAQVDAGNRVVVLLRVLGERFADEDTGIVDQRVDTAEALAAGRDEPLAVAGTDMSPWTVRMSGSCEGVIVREVATTA